jgi:UDP-2,4-diacetamido-2,4,6-trideoxy-beta-L-altropyranose hydrolase
MIVVVRADANCRIGIGHIARCLSLARELVLFGDRVILISSSILPDMLLSKSHSVAECRVLGGNDDDAQAFIEAIGTDIPDWVVVDHYGLDAKWHGVVRQRFGCCVLAIDDLGDRPLAADIIVDHNPIADYYAKYRNVNIFGARILSGPHFSLIARDYAGLVSHECATVVRSIGIFVGGSDPLGLSGKLLRMCRRSLGFSGDIEVVSTSMNPDLEVLRRLCEGPLNATLSIDLPDLNGFHQRHDLYIGAGGGSTWERCRRGLPSLVLAYAENQRVVVEALERVGAAKCVWWAGDSDLISVENALRELLVNYEMRRALSQASHRLVDGYGALRVAVCMRAGALTVRQATVDDAQLIYDWRNHPEVRQVSRMQLPIDFDTHVRWLESTLTSSAHCVLIAELGTRAVGVIRYHRTSIGSFEVSLYCDPVLTGIGLGSTMLRAGEMEIMRRCDTPITVTAFVLPGNENSNRLFQKNGFIECDGMWCKFVAQNTTQTVSGTFGGD